MKVDIGFCIKRLFVGLTSILIRIHVLLAYQKVTVADVSHGLNSFVF